MPWSAPPSLARGQMGILESTLLHYLRSGMILALVDDLLFRSRIQAAARVAGADVRVAADADAALAMARADVPALLVVDLNARRADPLRLVSAIRSDPALAATPIVGFVAHADAAAVAAARAAGVGEVLARSAFVARLPDLLGRAGREAGGNR